MPSDIQNLLSTSAKTIKSSEIREILELTRGGNVISFAGGLPNRGLFPKRELGLATQKAFEDHGDEILQYSSTEGFLPLREYIAQRYRE